MKNILLINEGYASSPKHLADKDHETVSHDALPIIFDQLNFDPTKGDEWREIHSTRWTSYRRMIKWLQKRESQGSNLMLVGKSMGGYEIYKMLTKIKLHFSKIVVVIIDGHSTIGKGMYGEKRAFNKRALLNSGDPMFRVINFYQKRKYPRGAKFIGADNEYYFDHKTLHEDIDHFNIVRNPIVLQGIKDAARWVQL